MNKQEIFKKGSTTYYYSSLFFPSRIRSDVFSLYAYVRTVDDYVDTSPVDIASFEKVWNQTNAAWKRGIKARNPIVDEFIAVAKRRTFEWKWIEAFWGAMRADLTKNNYKTEQELDQYMYGSAEVVGLMMAKILGLPPKAQRYAKLQGKAMQLINFIRDVSEDTAMGRSYLPQNERKRFGIVTGQEASWGAFIRFQIEKYLKIQSEAEHGYQYIPKRFRIPIQTAADMYRWTAEEIRRSPDIVWKKKVKPTPFRVITTVVKNTIKIPPSPNAPNQIKAKL